MDAAYLEPTLNEAYVFAGPQYARIKVIPNKPMRHRTVGPAPITENWPSLVKVGFAEKKIDAVIPVPDNPSEIWVFSGSQFARILTDPSPNNKDKVIYGPAPIAGDWPSLVKAGFEKIDAAFPTPGEKNMAYVFSGDRYARITLTPGKPESAISFGPADTAEHWPDLHKVGMTRLDGVIPAPGYPKDGYFFSGDRYIRLRVTVGVAKAEVIYGPDAVKPNWPVLDFIYG